MAHILDCRFCGAKYDLAKKPGSRYYCPKCMTGEPYGFRMSKLIGQMIDQLQSLEQVRAKANREINAVLRLAKEKGVRPRDLQRLRGLCWVSDEATADIYVNELNKLRIDIPQPTDDVELPGLEPDTPKPTLPGMVEASNVLPGM